MKKVYLVLSVTLTALFTGQLRAQNNNNPGGPANIAGNLYASNFADWNVPQGNNGPLSWSYSSACNSATSGGTTFKPLIVGAPIRIVDSNPALSENVTVTAVRTSGSGCLINVTPSNPHQNFYLTTSTGGLQEAINFANGQPYVVILTPDWQRAGGNNGMISAAKGNNNVSLLDQRTSVSIPYLWNGSTYVATPYGGGALLPNPGIVFGLTSSTGRVGVLSDFVGSASPAIWNGTPCTVGTNALLANGQCGPSGGSTIPGTIHQQIFSAGGGAATASNATLDAAGNSKTLSNDGLFNAFTAQTTPSSNDGIQNALQTTGNYVVAGNDYACTEGTYSSGYRGGIGIPAPFANGTQLFDRRGICGTYGDFIYNSFYNPTTTFWKLDKWVQNQLPATGGGVTVIPFRQDFEMSGSGINGFEGGGPDSTIFTQWNNELMTRGIITPFNFVQQTTSLGDNHIWQNFINNNRGSTDASGEGFNTVRNQINQNLTPMVLTANSTLAAGATLIQGTLISNIPFPGDGTYLIDFTKGSAIFRITGELDPNPGAGTAGQWTVSSTLTPDNIGRVAAAVSKASQRYGATTNETVTITGLTSALSTSQTVCYADGAYQESARVVSAGSFSGGTATGAVIALRYPHQANSYVVQGSHACNLVELRGNQLPGSFVGRQLFREIGALDSHHMLYSRTVFGGWNIAPNGFASTDFVASAGATLTRDGSNTVTVAVSDPFSHLANIGVIVSNCTDSSFNGVWQTTTDTTSVLSWTNAGAAGSTTCTSDVEILSRRNSFGVREAQEFPGAEIVNTNDPTTFAVCSSAGASCSVEPNTNFQVTAGDQLENHPYSDVVMGFDRNLMNFESQNSNSISSIMHEDAVGQDIPEGTNWARVSFTDSPSHYQGLGGTKKISNVLFNMLLNTTPFSSLFLLPTPVGSVFSFNGCVYGCADPRSQFSFYSFPTNNGSYFEQIHQDTGEVDIRDSNSVTNNLFVEKKLPGAWVMEVDSPGLASILSIVPGQVASHVFTGSGNDSHMVQTPTAWSIDVPMTTVAINSAAITTTGPVTVGGAGHSIATGTVSNTDLAGEFAFSGGTTASYTWAGTYANHPEVILTPQATTATSGAPFVTYTGVTSFTINFPNAFTGSVSYTVIGRN